MSPTQEAKSERSQAAILESALQLFSTQGYHGTSIREIATGAGLSTGNVYHYFPDKETLFLKLLDQYFAEIARPDSPFNKALAEGAFPNDLEALAWAAKESVTGNRRYLNLIYVDVVEFEGTHLRKYYSGMAERFASFLGLRYPGDSLQEQLGPGVDPETAIMLACRLFLQYFAVEILFGVPEQFGKGSDKAVAEMARILRHGMLKPTLPPS
jgi:AcrR family transcriptional regulator